MLSNRDSIRHAADTMTDKEAEMWAAALDAAAIVHAGLSGHDPESLDCASHDLAANLDRLRRMYGVDFVRLPSGKVSSVRPEETSK
jgi:hypothetical protein